MKDMETDTYETIINIRDSYANFLEALADELYQNDFDNTIAHFQYKMGEIEDESIGPEASIKISFDDNSNTIIILQNGTTGIIEKSAYTKLGEKTKGWSDRGSKGQGWKIWLSCTELVFTETITKEDDTEYYSANIIYANHEKRKIRVSTWSPIVNKVLLDLQSDGIDITPYKKTIKREIFNQGTRIMLYNIKEQIYDSMKRIYFESTLIKKWYPLLSKNLNYSVWISKNKTEEENINNFLKINIPPRPKPFEEIDPINRGFRKIDYKDPKTNNIVKVEMRDINLYYSRDQNFDYYEKGIAVIVLDRVVMYHKIPDSSRIEGFIYGEINADYLHDFEDSMHSGFHDVDPWNKTSRWIEKWGRELVSRVKDLGDISIDIPPSSRDYLESINGFLKDLINPSEEDFKGKSIENGMDEPDDSHEGKKYFTFMKTKLEGTEEEITKYKRGQKINIEIGIANPKDDDIKVKLKFHSTPDVAKNYYIMDLNLKKQEIITEKFQYIVDNRLPRGNLTLIAVLYPIEKLDDEFRQNQEVLKVNPLDTIRKKGNLEKIIRRLNFTKSNYSRGDKIELKALFDSNELRNLSPISTYVKTYIIHEDNLKKQNNNLLKRSMKDIDDSYQLDSSDNRGKYKGYIEIVDNSTSTIIEKMTVFCHVERFLMDVVVPKNVIEFEKEFDIKIKLENPTDTAIFGKLSLDLESQFKEQKIASQTLELNGFSKKEIVKKFTFHVSDNWLSGGVQIIGKFIPSIDPDNEDIIIKKIQLAKKESGILSIITFSKQLDMLDPVEIDSDGTIKINVLDYVFDRVDSKDGLNIQIFQQTIANLIYEVFKEMLPEDIVWYRFEEKFMNEIGKNFSGG